MGLCSSCKVMKPEYDEFRQEFDDVLVEGQTQQNHYCVMYEDRIPPGIYYETAECPWYVPKE